MKYLFIFLFSLNCFALEIPRLTRPVEDLAGVMGEEGKKEVEEIASQVYKDKIAQVSFLIIPSLENEILEDYSIKVANSWKLGDKGIDNGLLVLLSMAERKIRIEVGSGLEGEITDVEASRIIDGMKPFMRNSDYKGALLWVLERVKYYSEYNSAENIALRAELKAKKEKEDQQRAKELMKMFRWAFISLVFMMGFVYIGKVFFLKNNSLELKSKIKAAESEAVDLDKELSTLELKNKKLTIDNEKYKFYQREISVSQMEERKKELSREVVSMKNFLEKE